MIIFMQHSHKLHYVQIKKKQKQSRSLLEMLKQNEARNLRKKLILPTIELSNLNIKLETTDI